MSADITKIDLAKLQMRAEYGIASGGAVLDQVLLGVAVDFDNQVMRKLVSLNPNELATRLGEGNDVLLATKYDGEGTYVYFDQTHSPVAFGFSAGGRVRIGFAALNVLAQKLSAANVQKALLRCELCLQLTPEKKLRDGISEVIRVSFSGSQNELDRLKLVVLDIVMLDGKDLRANQADFAQTLALMQTLVGTDESALVHCMSAKIMSEKSIPGEFERLIAAGEEGVVVRRLNRAEAWKIKPQRSIDAVVIGFVEGSFEDKYGVASLLTALCYADQPDQTGLMQTFARIGSGFSDEQRINLLDRLRPLKVSEPIAMTDSSGRTVHFIRPELIAELRGEDLVPMEQGKILRSQLVRWNSDAKGYDFLGLSPCPRLSFATFVRLREDKNWRDGGARIEQIELARPNSASEASSKGGDGKVIRREVYLKGEMLRKLVVVHQPNAGEFPYLLYWTDYSAKRAEPLKVSLEIAANLERAQQLAEKLLAENLAKGWTRHG